MDTEMQINVNTEMIKNVLHGTWRAGTPEQKDEAKQHLQALRSEDADGDRVARVLELARLEARVLDQEQAANEAALVIEQRKERIRRFSQKVEQVTGIVGAVPSDGNLDIGVVGEITFCFPERLSGGYGNPGLRAIEPCPDCDGRIYSFDLDSLVDLGRWLNGGHRMPHEHYFAEDSTHPNAPKAPSVAEEYVRTDTPAVDVTALVTNALSDVVEALGYRGLLIAEKWPHHPGMIDRALAALDAAGRPFVEEQ